MSSSQEILNSIEDRLRQLAQEIAALESARSKLQREPPAAAEITSTAVAEITADEEWVQRRAAELAAQSREAAAA